MQIRIRHHDGREECIELDASRTVRFGSRRSADVVLGGPDVHSQHFGILLRNEHFTAVAFKRVQKIRVNGKLARKRILQPGDRIEVGENLIEVLVTGDGTTNAKTRSRPGKKRKWRTPPNPDRERAPGAVDQLAANSAFDELGDLDDLDVLAVDPTTSVDALSIDEQVLDAELSQPLADSQPSGAAGSNRLRQEANQSRWWNSTWFKTGVISAVIVPLLVLIVIYVQQLPTASDRFQIAQEFYRQRDFANAADAFGTYLKYHGDNGRADEAKVKGQLSGLLLGLERGVDAETLLTQLQHEVTQWRASRHSAYAQAGLAELLPALTADLTRQSRVASQQGSDDAAHKSLQQSGAALALIYRYVPPPLQRSCGVEQLQLHFTRMERQLNQATHLHAILKRIERRVDEADIEGAYGDRGELLDTYPELDTDGRLLAGMRAVGRAMETRVVPLSDESGRRAAPAIPLAWQQVVTDPQVGGQADVNRIEAVAIAELGVVYGVDMGTRQIAWRKIVGSGACYKPLRLGSNAFVLVDGARRALCCVAATTGETRWCVAVGCVAGTAAVGQDLIVAAGNNGVVRTIDASQGTVAGGLQLPQPLSVGPAIDPAAPRCYQVAEHSMVYVLALDQSKCLSSLYLGHEPGCVSIPPIVIGKHLLVFEQTGPAQSVIHVLRCGDSLESVQTIALGAAVMQAPVVWGSGIYLAGCDGRVYALSYDSGEMRRPLAVNAAIAPRWTHQERVRSVCLATANGRLYVGGEGVATYRPGTADEPLQLLSQVATDLAVTQVMRGAGGRVVAVGRNSDDGSYLLWQWQGTDKETLFSLTVPPAAPPLVTPAGDQFWVLRADGSVLLSQLPPRPGEWTTTVTRLVSKEERASQTAERDPSDVAAAWCGPVGGLGPLPYSNRLALVTRGAPQPQAIMLKQPLACPPVAVGHYFLLAARHGPVSLLDTERQQLATGEFLPELDVAMLPNWQSPAVLSDRDVVISDGNGRLFQLQIGRDGDALLQTALSTTAVKVNSPLAVVGSTVWGVSSQRELCRIQLPDLKIERGAVLRGTSQWGPMVVGTHAMLVTNQGELVCLGTELSCDWHAQLDMGDVAGVCAIDQRHVAVGSRNGRVVIFDVATGKQAAALIEPCERVAFGPVLMGEHLAALTADSRLICSVLTVNELLVNVSENEPSR